MIPIIINILSLLIMIISYILYKIYEPIKYNECNICYKYSRDLTKKGNCESCDRDLKLNILLKNKINLYINPKLLYILSNIYLTISFVLYVISVMYFPEIFCLFGSLFLLLFSITYCYSLTKILKIKKNGNNT